MIARYTSTDHTHDPTEADSILLAYAIKVVDDRRIGYVQLVGGKPLKSVVPHLENPTKDEFNAILVTDASFRNALLEESLVAFVPGEDFGGCGDRCVRISFACSEAQITAGIGRFAKFLADLR